MHAPNKISPWLLSLCLATAAGGAHAIAEVEPNNSLGGAQMLQNTAGAFSITGERSFADPSDDFFSFVVGGPGLLSIVASSPDAFADSIMGLFDPMGNLVASNDDSAGGGLMSAIQFNVPVGLVGRYTLGFSGYNPGLLACTATVTACYDTNGDFVFDTFVAGGGAGGSTGWTYALSLDGVALVPEPGSAWLLLPGAWAVLAWSRRRRSTRTA
jgi:hypothetical protein